MKKKPYVFRPYGQDEGSDAFLTEAEADRIQHRIDAIEQRQMMIRPSTSTKWILIQRRGFTRLWTNARPNSRTMKWGN